MSRGSVGPCRQLSCAPGERPGQMDDGCDGTDVPRTQERCSALALLVLVLVCCHGGAKHWQPQRRGGSRKQAAKVSHPFYGVVPYLDRFTRLGGTRVINARAIKTRPSFTDSRPGHGVKESGPRRLEARGPAAPHASSSAQPLYPYCSPSWGGLSISGTGALASYPYLLPFPTVASPSCFLWVVLSRMLPTV
ncbi:hypothetical protein F4780DRAFT_56575 [Xylariomycetidae sp. FL0641]|nr:hypothetical protein F4780DRAFT_56575 [Xylariomycetidae sp. FL0641]